MKRTYLGAFLIASLLFVGTVPAFAFSCKNCPDVPKIRSNYSVFSFGNRNAGASGSYSVSVMRIGNYSTSITVSAGGTVSFLGKTARSVGVDVTVRENEGSVPRGSVVEVV